MVPRLTKLWLLVQMPGVARGELPAWSAPWVPGLGLEFAFRLSDRLRLTAETRYDKGLLNISALPVVDDGSIRTGAACLLIGLGYRLGGPL